MSLRLAERLSAARRHRFVGRAAEQALFQSALTAAELPFQVLYVFGPGGVGKTTLLNEFARQCEDARVPAVYLDARNLDPSPEGFLGALRSAFNVGPAEAIAPFLAQRQQQHVILVDTYEILAPLDVWLRETFLPELPENTLIVLAGREPLPPAWRADAGWQALVRAWPLRNLSPDEGRAYLLKRDVPAEQHSAVLHFTHGHPLALSLVADVFHQRPGLRFQPETSPDVIKTLLERFVQKVPGPAHRAALEACSLVRVTTEDLLATMLANPDAHELFAWLRGLSFIESGPGGLFPHDLAREAIAADVRWRNPNWYAELHRRARNDYIARLQRASGLAQQHILVDYVFLHRDNPVVRPFFEWQTSGGLLADAANAMDWPALRAMAAQHEGAASADLAQRWFERQPQNVIVLRDSSGQAAGFMLLLALQQASADDLNADPGAQAAWRYLQRAAPLRPGEMATLFRFWMARDTYQDVSPAQSLLFINCVRHYLATPGLAHTFIPCAEADFWAPVFAYADLARLPEADFEVGGRRYGMYGHDWRVTPPMAWLALLAERETSSGSVSAPTRAPEALIVLSESDFAEAVRDALNHFTQTDLLSGNPLLRSRLVMERARGQGDDVNADRSAALQALVKEAAALLASPRDAKLYRALEATYFRPAPTQEQAAEQLDLPFSTYRRHLKAGVTRVIEILWQREIGGGEQ